MLSTPIVDGKRSAFQDSGSSESYGDRVMKVAGPTGMWRTISHSVTDPHVRGNNVIQCGAEPQVMEMKAANSPVSYGSLTVDRVSFLIDLRQFIVFSFVSAQSESRYI